MNDPIWIEVQAERDRVHAEHGSTSTESMEPFDPAWLSVLMEEVGEVAREFNEARSYERPVVRTLLRAELIQVAAMAGAWADALGER